ncbi:unnamed protein product [Heligmosomoides polygyrus]|uniref:Uncharacterized protein n=1 Tax=Heligmosomoides polygyrus TaxID=6339 RepID=A0A183F9V7_HELPZ|nr:unnamed protein product [Heligmosomoides polygyrus]
MMVLAEPQPKETETPVLGLFFKCPGRQRQNDLTFACSIHEKSFKEVVPSAVETIDHLRFDTVFRLAKLISIYDHERCLERKRLLMMDPK